MEVGKRTGLSILFSAESTSVRFNVIRANASSGAGTVILGKGTVLEVSAGGSVIHSADSHSGVASLFRAFHSVGLSKSKERAADEEE